MGLRRERGDAALALLKSFLENSSLITPKDGPKGPQMLGIVITTELAFAMCEEFGWNPEIVSKNGNLQGTSKTEEEKRIIIP